MNPTIVVDMGEIKDMGEGVKQSVIDSDSPNCGFNLFHPILRTANCEGYEINNHKLRGSCNNFHGSS